MTVIVEISARHCHLSKKDFHKLFGRNACLTKKKELSQPGQFAAAEKVVLRTAKDELKLRVVGPFRNKTQVEISKTDGCRLGLKPPVRLSGRLAGSLAGILVGPAGRLRLKSGIIVAQRHFHCPIAAARKLELKNGQKISLKIAGQRSVTFHQVAVRVAENFVSRVHLDTDEANAAGLSGQKGRGEIINNF